MTSKREKHADEMDINITPMLDIVFIMLIFFIVTTSFVRETGIDPQRPVAETATDQGHANILIGIDRDGLVWVNRQIVEVSQVRQIVENAVNENPASSAVLIADEEAATGVVLDIMDQVRLGGVANIAIAAEAEST